MKLNIILTGLTLGALYFSAGCANLNVAKVQNDDPSIKGIRYALPKAFIKVTGAPGGSPTDEVVYLPDSDNTYAIDSTLIFAAYTLNVDMDPATGLLTKVEWAPDTTGVATSTISKAADTATTIVQANVQKQKDIDDAKKTLADADLKVTIARQKLAAATDQASKDAAQQELDQDTIDRNAAYNALQRLLGKGTIPLSAAAAAAHANAAASAPARALQDPTLYEVVETQDGMVKLVKITNPTLP